MSHTNKYPHHKSPTEQDLDTKYRKLREAHLNKVGTKFYMNGKLQKQDYCNKCKEIDKQAIHEAYSKSPTARMLSEQKERYGKERYEAGFDDAMANAVIGEEQIKEQSATARQLAEMKEHTAKEIFSGLDKIITEDSEIWHNSNVIAVVCEIRGADYQALKKKYLKPEKE